MGGARTALFNFLYAKARGGVFIIRVEDTDRERSTAASERAILDSLRWLGIQADEGPEEGGPFGPYRQSERLEIYRAYVDRLITKKRAFPCFCKSEDLAKKQEIAKATGERYAYDGTCRSLTAKEAAARQAAGEPHTIRFVAEGGTVRVRDLILGDVSFDAGMIDDFIIVKSDGYPAYNFAVVVDDNEMRITHVVRGVGHLSNTPRQILIGQALDLPIPQYAHISEIVGTDKKKLSKRRGATSVLFFRDLGYLSEAFTNYMSLLGWYPEDSVEFMPDGELARKFDLARCSKSPSMFDFFLVEQAAKNRQQQTRAQVEEADGDAEVSASDAEESAGEARVEGLSLEELRAVINKKSKLNWLNNRYIRHLPLEQVWAAARPFVLKEKTLADLVTRDEARVMRAFDAVRVYLDTLEEASAYLLEILQEQVALANDAREFLAAEEPAPLWDAFAAVLTERQPRDPDAFAAAIKEAGERTGAKGKQLFMPIRIGTTGRLHGLELPRLFTLLGPDEVLRRLAAVREQI